MKLLSPLRYLAFAGVAVVVAAALFFVLNVIVAMSRETSTGIIERWIVNASCTTYELTGSIRDPKGVPVPFAIVEAAYQNERLVTRSGTDGRFRIVADRAICDRRPRDAAITVLAEEHRPQRRVLPFNQTTLDLVLQPADGIP